MTDHSREFTTPHVLSSGSTCTSASAWLAALGCGALVGAALGLALAPRRGRDTRHAIAAATRDGRARAADMMGRCRETLSSRRERVSDLVHSAAGKVRSVAGGPGDAQPAVAREEEGHHA